MKRILSACLSTAIAVSSAICYAEENTDIQYGIDTNKNTLNITAQLAAARSVVTIAMGAYGQKDFSKDNTPVIFFVYETDENGNLNIIEPFAENLPSGRYSVMLNGVGIDESFDFVYMNKNDGATQALIDAINSAATSGDIKKIVSGETVVMYEDSPVEDCAAKLGIDTTDAEVSQYLERYLDSSAEIRNSLDEEAYTPDSFLFNLSAYICISLINDGLVDTAMEKYAEYFDITYADYRSISEDIKNELNSLLQAYSFDISKLPQNYKNIYTLACIKTSQSWDKLRDIVTENQSEIGINTADCNTITASLRYKVYLEMFEERSTYKTVEDVKASFTKAVASVKTSDTKNNGGTTGGGVSRNESSSVTAAVVPNVYPEIGKAEIQFTDIDSHFSKEYVIRLAQKEVISGYGDGSFAPDNTITRAEFATIIAKMFEINAAPNTAFEDVAVSDWFSPYVKSLAATGIVSGYDGRFNPAEKITRQDAAVICVKCAEYMSRPLEGEKMFADQDKISEYALNAVKALAANEIAQGDGTNFYPTDYITRGEAAVMLCRLYDKIG